MIKTAIALAAAGLLAGCSYHSESNILGYRSTISYSTPGAYPPASPPGPPPGPPSSAHYSSPPGYAPSGCWVPGHYNRWGYWVPGRYRRC